MLFGIERPCGTIARQEVGDVGAADSGADYRKKANTASGIDPLTARRARVGRLCLEEGEKRERVARSRPFCFCAEHVRQLFERFAKREGEITLATSYFRGCLATSGSAKRRRC